MDQIRLVALLPNTNESIIDIYDRIASRNEAKNIVLAFMYVCEPRGLPGELMVTGVGKVTLHEYDPKEIVGVLGQFQLACLSPILYREDLYFP